MRVVLACIASSMLSGCAAVAGAVVGDAAYSGAFRTKIEDAKRLSADDLRKLAEVRFLDTAAGVSHAPIGKAGGLSCLLSAGPLIPAFFWRPGLSELNGTTPEEVARTQLRISAMRKGANAVVSPTCKHSEGLDWANNCFESWVCVGEAISVN